MSKKKKCPHYRYCMFRRAYGYCIKHIGEECTFYQRVDD